MNDYHWKKHCCTQTNGDDEDNAPPASEDNNRLKVKKNNQLQVNYKSNSQKTKVHFRKCIYLIFYSLYFTSYLALRKQMLAHVKATVYKMQHMAGLLSDMMWPRPSLSPVEAVPSARGEFSLFTQQHHEKHHLPAHDPHTRPSGRGWVPYQCDNKPDDW